MTRHNLTPETEREIATSIHLLAIAGLARNPQWTIENIVFQGGTSISFAWNSPRHSEDLDFVIARGFEIKPEMDRVLDFVRDGMLTRHPGVSISLRDKSKNASRMSVFMFDAEDPKSIGKVKVKLEFWNADPKAVLDYGKDSVYKQIGRADISPLFSVATPERIMMDKINAIAHRDYLKWRDIFDVWYLRNHFAERLRERFSASDIFTGAMDVSAALYGRQGIDAAAGLREFLNREDQTVLAMAESDLKPWIPPELWAKFWPDTVKQMLSTTKETVSQALDLLAPGDVSPPAPRGVNFR